MPNPKRKFSHARTGKRRGTWKTRVPEMTPNKVQGDEPYVLPHCASPEGYYKSRRLPGYKDK